MTANEKAGTPGGGRRPRKRNRQSTHGHYSGIAWLSIGQVCRRYAVPADVIIGWTENRFFPAPIWAAGRPWWNPSHLDLHDWLVYRGGAVPGPEKARMFDVLYWRSSR